jgi:hypothetical protein
MELSELRQQTRVKRGAADRDRQIRHLPPEVAQAGRDSATKIRIHCAHALLGGLISDFYLLPILFPGPPGIVTSPRLVVDRGSVCERMRFSWLLRAPLLVYS